MREGERLIDGVCVYVCMYLYAAGVSIHRRLYVRFQSCVYLYLRCWGELAFVLLPSYLPYLGPALGWAACEREKVSSLGSGSRL